MKKNLKVIRFLLFLLSNGALISFFKNRIFNQAQYNKDKSISKVMSFVRKYVESGDDLFYAAFIFQESKEGNEYWARLCDKWEETTKKCKNGKNNSNEIL